MPGFKGTYVFPSQASAPGSPVQGQVYFNTADGYYYGWNGTKWVYLVGLDPTDDFKQSTRVASTANVTISPGGTSLAIDGVTLVNGDRVLLKDQTLPAENGVYDVGGVGTSVTLTRSSDSNASAYMADTTLVTVQQGTRAADTAWELVTDNPITLGTTPLYWTRAWPAYTENGPRNPWAPSGVVCQNFPRDRWVSTLNFPTAATWTWAGGGVLPAGRPVSNVAIWVNSGANASTIRHLSLVRASDGAVLTRTANAAGTTPTPAIMTTPFQASYTSPVDVPVYVVLALAVPTTGWAVGGFNTVSGTLLAPAPILAQTTVTAAPTTTPPAVGSTIPVGGQNNMSFVMGWYLT